MTEETAKKTERDSKDPELDKKENEELTPAELTDVSGGLQGGGDGFRPIH